MSCSTSAVNIWMCVVGLSWYERRERLELGSRAMEARMSSSRSFRCFSYLLNRLVTSLRAASWSSGMFSTKNGVTPRLEMCRMVVSVSSCIRTRSAVMVVSSRILLYRPRT